MTTRARSDFRTWRFVIPLVLIMATALYKLQYKHVGIIDQHGEKVLVGDDGYVHKNNHISNNANNNANNNSNDNAKNNRKHQTNTYKGNGSGNSNSSDYSFETVIEEIQNETTHSIIYTTTPFLPRPWHGEKPHGWCWTNDSQADSKTPAGLVFVKMQKASSSTLTGVTLHVAHRHGESMEKPCLSIHEHSLERFPDRDKFRSFLFTSVREPAARALSYLQYKASNRNYTDDWVFQRLQTNLIHPTWTWEKVMYDNGYQLGYLSTTEKVSPNHKKKAKLALSERKDPTLLWPRDEAEIRERVDSVLEDYDLIMVTERMDESLVALQLLLNLNASDLLYVHGSKVTGSYAAVSNKCHLLRKVQNKTKTDEYFATSETWMRRNWGDYLLYHSANALLDATIESLGKKRFQNALKDYRDTFQKAQELCESDSIFPCSSNGTYVGDADCYKRDWGCGYKCLNRAFPT